jgi:hypothetical protein
MIPPKVRVKIPNKEVVDRNGNTVMLVAKFMTGHGSRRAQGGKKSAALY